MTWIARAGWTRRAQQERRPRRREGTTASSTRRRRRRREGARAGGVSSSARRRGSASSAAFVIVALALSIPLSLGRRGCCSFLVVWCCSKEKSRAFCSKAKGTAQRPRGKIKTGSRPLFLFISHSLTFPRLVFSHLNNDNKQNLTRSLERSQFSLLPTCSCTRASSAVAVSAGWAR